MSVHNTDHRHAPTVPDMVERLNQTWLDVALDEVREHVPDEEALDRVRHVLTCALRRGATTKHYSFRKGLR